MQVKRTKRTFFKNIWGQRKNFWTKNHLPAGGIGFELFSWFYLWCCWKHNCLKKLFRPFFLVLCIIKNLSEQFLTAHIVSFLFFLCIKKLHFVRTHKVDGDISKRTLFFRWFWPVFSRNSEYRDSRKQFHWPKKRVKQRLWKVQDHFCTNWVKVENKIIRTKVTFQVKKNTFTFFLVIPSFADVHNNFITLHTLFNQNCCK